MWPTPHAEALAAPLASAPGLARNAESQSELRSETGQAHRHHWRLRLCRPDADAAVDASHTQRGAGIDIRLRAITRAPCCRPGKEIDLAIGPIDGAATLDMTPLFSERLAMIGRRHHPAMKGALSAKLCRATHLLVCRARSDRQVDEVLRERLARRVALTVPHLWPRCSSRRHRSGGGDAERTAHVCGSEPHAIRPRPSPFNLDHRSARPMTRRAIRRWIG